MTELSETHKLYRLRNINVSFLKPSVSKQTAGDFEGKRNNTPRALRDAEQVLWFMYREVFKWVQTRGEKTTKGVLFAHIKNRIIRREYGTHF